MKMHYLRTSDPDDTLVFKEGGKTTLLSPVRFIIICKNGHMDDFPWHRWVGCPVKADGQKPVTPDHNLEYYEDGSGDLDAIRVRCVKCKKSRSLGGITSTAFADPKIPHAPDASPDSTYLTNQLRKQGDPHAGCCRGKFIWHDEERREECDKPMLGTLLSALNVYYPRTITSILIPDTPFPGHKGFDEAFHSALGMVEAPLVHMLYQKGDRT